MPTLTNAAEDVLAPQDNSPIDLADLLGRTRSFGIYGVETTGLMRKEFDKANAALDAALQAAGATADSRGYTPTVKQDELQARFRTQESVQQFASVTGVNLADSNSLAVQIGEQMRNKFQEALQLDAIIGQKQSVGFFDSPIRFLANQLTIGGDIDKYNAAVTQFNTMAQGLQELNATTQTAAQTQKAIEQPLTQAGIAESVRATQAEIEVKMRGLEAQMHTSNAQQLRELYQMDAAELEADTKIWQLQTQERQYQLQLEHLRLSKAAAARAAAGKSKDENAAESYLIQRYVAGYKSVHGVEPPISEISDLKAMATVGGSTAKQRIDYYVNKGEEQIFAPTNPLSSKDGPDPASTLEALELTGRTLNAGEQQVKESLLDPALAVAGKGSAAERKTAYNNEVASKAKQFHNNVDVEPTRNPYRSAPLATFASAKAVSGTPWWQKVIAPQLLAKNADLDSVNHQRIIDLTRAAVNAKQLTAEQAVAGITTWAQTAVATNNKQKFSRLGVPSQSQYNVTIATPRESVGLTGALVNRATSALAGPSSKTYDLTNKTQVRELFIRGLFSK